MVAVNVLQLNLTIQRRSRAHVENSPPPEKLNFNKKSLARILLFLKNNKTKGGPCPLAVPKIVCSLFASHNFDRYANSHSLFPPPAAVVFLALFEERYTAFVNLFYW